MVNNTKVRKNCIQFLVIFPTHVLLTLSPQPFTFQHFTTHINFSHKVSFLSPFPTLHYTSLHFTSFLFTTLSDYFYFILLRFCTLLDDFQHTLSFFPCYKLDICLSVAGKTYNIKIIDGLSKSQETHKFSYSRRAT